uniref:Fiber protein Fb34 n=1 Tax=Ananas comosus var. bracteatus TaxID=296719 RepID=A0A6V7QCY1_ANACO|nr:unnamed protein product [Ananas comosus var. bracteatus]
MPVFVPVLVLALDLIAFVLAIVAEHRRSAATVVTNAKRRYTYCAYGSDVATAYGVAALLLLAASQAAVMTATRCFCCGSPLRPGKARAFAGICFLACCGVVLARCIGSQRIPHAVPHRLRERPPSCETVRKGVFAAGAAFVFFTAALAELHYAFYAKARAATLFPPAAAAAAPPHRKESSIGMTSLS